MAGRVVFRPSYFNESKKVSVILKTFHIRPVKEIKYVFDPYTRNTETLRSVMSLLHSKKVLKTSSARTKIDVREDQCEPQMDVTFADGHKVIFKTENLKISEVMERLDFFCKAKDTSQPEADMALTKMSGKMKKKK